MNTLLMLAEYHAISPGHYADHSTPLLLCLICQISRYTSQLASSLKARTQVAGWRKSPCLYEPKQYRKRGPLTANFRLQNHSSGRHIAHLQSANPSQAQTRAPDISMPKLMPIMHHPLTALYTLLPTPPRALYPRLFTYAHCALLPVASC